MIPARLTQAYCESLSAFFDENFRSEVSLPEDGGTEASLASSIGSSIGFTSDVLNGSIFLGTTFDALRYTHPMVALGADVTEDQLFEWAGEIANQVMGRFRNNVLPYKLDLDMSLPTVVQGVTIHLAEMRIGERIFRRVVGPEGHQFSCIVSFVYKDGFNPPQSIPAKWMQVLEKWRVMVCFSE